GYGTDRQQTIGRLVRALNEYFVGGIKTNISLFRRILSDPEFQSGKLDTGYLDRLLALSAGAGPAETRSSEVAAVAAGLFAALDPAGATSNGASSNGAGKGNRDVPSTWKRAARAEALRIG
ncbi:MAG TPA: acetyl-CoA carboxylase biotin carboxylase subunit, partial [Terriglobales bacterium]